MSNRVVGVVGREDEILTVPKLALLRKRLNGKYVQSGTQNRLSLQRVHQRGLVDTDATADGDKDRVWFHGREFGSTTEVEGGRCAYL